MKFTVICGPELKDHDSRILDLIEENTTPNTDTFVLPEMKMGASQVRALVEKVIAIGNPAIFVTRYNHAVYEFAVAVDLGEIAREDVMFILVRYEKDGSMKVTNHMMDETNEYVGNNWPFGILE